MYRYWGTVAILALGLEACHSVTNLPAMPTPADAATAPSKIREVAMLEWNGQFSGLAKGAQRVIESAAQWQALWAEIGQARRPRRISNRLSRSPYSWGSATQEATVSAGWSPTPAAGPPW